MRHDRKVQNIAAPIKNGTNGLVESAGSRNGRGIPFGGHKKISSLAHKIEERQYAYNIARNNLFAAVEVIYCDM